MLKTSLLAILAIVASMAMAADSVQRGSCFLKNDDRWLFAGAGVVLSDTTAAEQWERKPSWKMEGQSWSAAGPGPRWDMLLSKTKHRDGSLSTVVRIAKAADLNVANPGGSTDETLPGYEAGLVFRHTGNKYYRVCLSTVYKEVALWRTDGGWLAVREVPLAVNVDYRVRVDFSGNRIKVFFDEKEILDVTDVRPLLAEGHLGLAVKQGQTSFSGTAFNPIQPLSAGPTPATFTQKKWHGQNWFFHGLEPIARLDPGLNLHCKLAPCFRMIGYFQACWLRDCDYFVDQTKLEVLESGPRLKCLIQGTRRNGEVVSKYLTTISLNAETRSYVYDFAAEFTVQAGKTWTGLEFCDYWINNVVGPSIRTAENDWSAHYGWIGWQSAKDGKLYKYPINHHFFYPGYCLTTTSDPRFVDYFKVKGDDGFIGFFNDDVNPVLRIVKAQADVQQALCANWFDLHLSYAQPKDPNHWPWKAGTAHAVQFQLTGYDRAKGEEILGTASFPPDAVKEHLDWEYPCFQWGMNHFRKGIKVASPHHEMLWRKGGGWAAWGSPPDSYWDRTVGYGDKDSLRIDGPLSIATGVGGWWFMPAFTAKRYVISAMVKTENVRGEGPYIRFSGPPNVADQLVTHLTGARDWTKVAFVTDKLARATQIGHGDLRVGLSGTGKAWFDDVEIRALKDEENVVLPSWEKTPSPPPDPEMLMWLKMNDKEGAGALDYSRHGHSAELKGLKWVEDPARGACVQFDGKGVAAIEHDRELDLVMPFSLSCWIKPAVPSSGGQLPILGQYNHLWLWLDRASPTAYKIGFYMNQKVRLSESAPVPADAWAHLVLSCDKKNIRIYLNGAKVAEQQHSEEKILPSGQSLCLGGYYPSGGAFCGRMSEVKLLRRALSDEDVRREYETSKSAKE